MDYDCVNMFIMSVKVSGFITNFQYLWCCTFQSNTFTVYYLDGIKFTSYTTSLCVLQMELEKKKAKKIAEQKKAVDGRLDQEIKRNTELQKEMYR